MSTEAWKVSLHGGHSGEYCEHALATLEELLEEAVVQGFSVYGVSEHAPRSDARFLHPQERARGWGVAELEARFDDYARELAQLAEGFEGRLRVLRAFESEAVPEAGWLGYTRALRSRYDFDYVVGAVHHVEGRLIDGSEAEFLRLVEEMDGVERVAVGYYERLAEMVEALRPEVVAHFDLVRKHAARVGSIKTPAVERAARRALEALRDTGAILDVSVAPLREGWQIPYPAPDILRWAVELGLPVCLGDDAHALYEVGVGLEEGREYLGRHGVRQLTLPVRGGGHQHLPLF